MSALEGQDPQLRVLVVDDHEVFRNGLSQLLEARGVCVVGKAANGGEALYLAARTSPDVVIMDLSMPGMSGAEATRRLIEASPKACVLVLTVLEEESEVLDAIVAGAVGYLLKDAPVDQIVSGLEAAARGESLISLRIAGKLVRRLRSTTPTGPHPQERPLSERELEVLTLVTQGCDNAEIGDRLFITQNTVKNHVSHILGKLGVANRVQASVRAINDGLLDGS